jgi:hypothetical protein
MRNLAIWLLMFIPALVVEIFCYLTNPVAALFTVRELRTDRVKRSPWDNGTYTLVREYLPKPIRWWQTHDNACDEWWYGAFNTDSHFKFLREATQEDYDSSWWIRYCCRVMWMYRNNAYGFMYNLFSRPLETAHMQYMHGLEDNGKFWYLLNVFPSSFQLEVQIPIWGTNRYMSINMGWKNHKGFPRVMYANRIPPFAALKEYKQ